MVVVLPWFGVLMYLIVRGGSMSERDHQQAAAREAAFQAYIQRAVESGVTADELAKLAALQAQGAITDVEFAQQKTKLLR